MKGGKGVAIVFRGKIQGNLPMSLGKQLGRDNGIKLETKQNKTLRPKTASFRD